ncbi:hypothetical protein ACIP4Y_35920 [Streptomyces sp. NPDC088810]|uniref:hypothetical protein n=1 Tax=Streptomyces sp. NPDC088810 TaxID=3365904 RepID=UPI003828F4A6
MEAADQIPGERGDRHERYRNWSMQPASADRLLQTLLALSIHALALDGASDSSQDVPGMLGQLRLTDIALAATARPSHELLAGLPHLSSTDQLHVNSVKVLIHDDASALALGRLSQMIRITLIALAATLQNENPVCADIPGG